MRTIYMPDRRTLAIGDSIKLVNVPKADLEQRINESPRQEGDMLHTATVYELIIQQRPVVIIDDIDEYQQPWFSVRINVDNSLENHSLAVIDDESWEIVHKPRKDTTPPVEHQIAVVTTKIDTVTEKYEEEYLALAKRSEMLYDEKNKLKMEYDVLNEKTGLNALFEKLAKLKSEA